MEADLLTGDYNEESSPIPIPEERIHEVMEPEIVTNMEPESTTEDLICIGQDIVQNQVIEKEEIKEIKEEPVVKEKQVEKTDSIDHVEIWCQYLNVRDLMYWRDPRKSGAVLGGSLTVLLSLAYCSVISVLATSLLLLLAGSFLYRTYKYVLQAVHKTSDGAPYQALMELDLNVDVEEVKRLVEMGVPILNKNLARLRSIFLIEDIVDSVKMALVLWIMTYIGAWFNGLTLVILSVASAFSIPKVYETYKTEIDTCLNLAIAQVKETYTNIRAKIPIGNKKKDE